MKPQTLSQLPGTAEHGDGRQTDLSAETALLREIGELREWLTAQGLDLREDHARADEGSRDRLYWRYGYYMGLKQAVAMLTSSGATVH